MEVEYSLFIEEFGAILTGPCLTDPWFGWMERADACGTRWPDSTATFVRRYATSHLREQTTTCTSTHISNKTHPLSPSWAVQTHVSKRLSIGGVPLAPERRHPRLHTPAVRFGFRDVFQPRTAAIAGTTPFLITLTLGPARMGGPGVGGGAPSTGLQAASAAADSNVRESAGDQNTTPRNAEEAGSASRASEVRVPGSRRTGVAATQPRTRDLKGDLELTRHIGSTRNCRTAGPSRFPYPKSPKGLSAGVGLLEGLGGPPNPMCLRARILGVLKKRSDGLT